MVKSKIGEMIPQDWKAWVNNILKFSIPLFVGTFFAQLAMGVDAEKALAVSLLTFYGAIADFISKRNAETKYK